MIYITQKDRFIYLSPLPKGDLLFSLNKEFSYYKKYFNGKNYDYFQIKLYNSNKGRLPIGMTQKLNMFLKEKNISHEIEFVDNDIRKNLKQINIDKFLNTTKLYDFQKIAVKQFIKGIIGGFAKGGIIEVPTGGGKTITTIQIIKMIAENTLVIVPTINIKNQWEKYFQDELNKVKIMTYQSIKKKNQIWDYNFVIFDECHHTAANTLRLIGENLNEKAVTLGLSATPMMRDDDNMIVEGILGKIIYKIRIRDLIEMGHLADAEIMFLNPVSEKNTEFLTITDLEGIDEKNYFQVLKKYVVDNISRNNKIIEYAIKSPKPVLILTDRIEHGKILKNMINKKGHDNVKFFYSKNPFFIKDIKNNDIIIGTSVFNEGVDIPFLRTLIIASGGKSYIKTIQQIGRVLRIFLNKEKALIYDFKEEKKYIGNHYKKRKKIYEENFEVKFENN